MRIRIHPSFGIYLLCISALSSVFTCLGVLSALLIHEMGHCLACKMMGLQIDLLELTPLGGVMTYRGTASSFKGIKGVLIHVAGPIGNYLALLLIHSLSFQQQINLDFLRSLILGNLSMLLLNMLPVLPLDGGQIIFCLGYCFLPLTRLICCLTALGMTAGILGLFLAAYGLMTRRLLNCSLLIVSVHLIFSAKRHQNTLLAENFYMIVQERMMKSSSIRKMIYYQVPSDTLIIKLSAYLKQNAGLCFVFTEDHHICELSEQDFCMALLSAPSSTVWQAYQNFMQYKEKNQQNSENPIFMP